MRLGAVILAVCVIGACAGSGATVADPDAGGASSTSSSSGSTTSSSGSSSGGGSGDAGGSGGRDAAREANAPGCPGAFTDNPPGHCTVGLACAYDEGTCKCLGYCGGVQPPEDVDFSHWGCAKYTGCPDPKPAPGSTCKTPGQTCTYGDCCSEQFTCVGSKWSSGGMVCPP